MFISTNRISIHDCHTPNLKSEKDLLRPDFHQQWIQAEIEWISIPWSYYHIEWV